MKRKRRWLVRNLKYPTVYAVVDGPREAMGEWSAAFQEG